MVYDTNDTAAEENLKYTPPNEFEAEQMVLGACILDPEHTVAVAYARAEDFYKTAHRVIFAVMRNMRERGEQIDLVTLAAALKGAKEMETVGGTSYLAQLVSIVPTSAGFRAHERLIMSAAQRRAVIWRCKETEQAAYDTRDADKIISECITGLNDIRRHEGDIIMPYGNMINLGYSDIERRFDLAREGKISGIPTGFRDLDKKLHGLQPQFYILAGASGMGKTALADKIVRNAAAHFLREWEGMPEEQRPPAPENSVGVISLEMGPKQLSLRAISSESEVPLSRLLAGTIHDSDWARLSSAAGALHRLPIHCAFSAFSDRQIERVIDDMAQRLHVKFIVFDYLQLEHCEDHDGTREQEVTKMSRMHKRKIAQHGIPHLVISSLNRGFAGRPDKRPVPSDLRESGSIEFDADVIIFIYRDEVYNCKCPRQVECSCGRRGKAEVIVSKGRMEGTGTVDLLWHGNTTSFRDVE